MILQVISVSLGAQVKTISFLPYLEKERIIKDSSQYAENAHENISISTLKFYVSKFCFYKSGKKVFEETNSFHLMDWDDKMSFHVSVKNEFDEVGFSIGIDSATNVSGAFGGDLDPTKGMYWTWQSGYINFKIEGTSPICKTRNHAFQWHIGGYKYPNTTIQEIKLRCTTKKDIVVVVDLKELLEQSSLVEHPEVMSPSKQAVHLSSIFKTCFSIAP